MCFPKCTPLPPQAFSPGNCALVLPIRPTGRREGQLTLVLWLCLRVCNVLVLQVTNKTDKSYVFLQSLHGKSMRPSLSGWRPRILGRRAERPLTVYGSSSCLLLVVRPGATSSVLAPSSDAPFLRSPSLSCVSTRRAGGVAHGSSAAWILCPRLSSGFACHDFPLVNRNQNGVGGGGMRHTAAYSSKVAKASLVRIVRLLIRTRARSNIFQSNHLK